MTKYECDNCGFQQATQLARYAITRNGGFITNERQELSSNDQTD